MITLVKYGNNFNQLVLILSGLSTDNKPTGTYIERDDIGTVVATKVIPNGSIFNEIDTGNIYQYDKENQTWNKTSGGGGGGSSTLIEKSVSTNGVYNASDDSADGYSKVTVSVPNTYVAEDEGKVVNNSALVSQTAMSSDITENGTIDTTLYNSVTVNVASGGSATRNDVRFLDYDGTIVQTYSAADFANLTELPANPSHTGLTAQGWNWTLADAKTYVASYGKLDIGQMYASNTTDGKTYLHIRLGEGRLKPYLGLSGNSNGTAVSIDWGDGSAAESVTLNTSTIYTPHEYASDGVYVISITVTNGTISLNSTSNSSDLFRKTYPANANNDKVYANILTKAELGTGVTSIGDYAFYGCSSLISITISSTVTSIGQNAFQNCSSLTSITIPLSVTSIGTFSFNSCYSLSSVTIPSSVTSITNNVFQNCYSLTLVTLPSTLTSMGNGAFQSCLSITSITLPSSLTSIGQYAFNGCFSLSLVTIPSSVTSIGNYAFQNCSSLSSVTIPSSVTSIGQSVFYYCYSLTSVTLPSTVTSIGSSAFNSCYSLTSITLPSSLTSIGDSAFYSCTSLTSITLPSTVTSIGSSAFSACFSLTSVTIPSTVTSIGTYAFQNCYSLTSITLPSSLTSIGSSIFYGCYSLTSVTIPSSATSIGGSAFYNCYSLTSVTIPSSVTVIGASVFQNCYALTSITIPSLVTAIGGSAFNTARGLGFIKFESTTPPTVSNANTWSNVPADCIIYVPTGYLTAYTSASNYPSSSAYTYVEY